MRTFYHGMGLVAAFCLTFVILISSVEAVVYLAPDHFEKEYRKYRVTKQVKMQMDDLLEVTDEMMAYLKGDREDLIIETVVNGEEREFFNEKEKRHMVDVQNLFLGAIKLREGAALLALLCGAYLLLKEEGLVLCRMLQWGIGLFIGSMVALAALISTDFTKYFTVFHHIFFDNDDWLLNPKTDLLINIVPEGFFRDTAFMIAVLFLSICLLVWLMAAGLKKRAKKQRNVT
ncbi:MAG: TIGR01906 family membrane protein [Anaerotignum sp.]|nr:TIGR01906 family membrane protein [Anaerotignum sp.]